jgi:uncharacterized phage-associated protein
MLVYAPSLIANAFLYKARGAGARLSHMKLQKLVFFVHAWGLALHGESHLSERPQAWPYGPVFETLYHQLKEFGSSDVAVYLKQMNPQTGRIEALIPSREDAGLWDLLEQVWKRYGHFSAIELSALTHEPGGPWEASRNAQQLTLSDDQVKSHYRGKLQHASS